MTLVDRALWIMERNSACELSLPAIAEACGVSRSHLANAFGSTTGWPVVKYLRARRLSVAAEALTAGAPDILGVALQAGYGSHEAFSRAFREQFGTTPERVRERATTEGLALAPALALQPRTRPVLEPPYLREARTIRAAGLKRRHAFDTVVGIPGQWQEFMAQHYHAIPRRLDAIPIGLLLPADEDGGFDYLCAAEVSASGDRVPEGLTRIEIPPRRYAVFEHRMHVSTIFDTYSAIWDIALPERGWAPADAPTIEHHHPSFDPATGEGGLSLWIPLAEAVGTDAGIAMADLPETAR